MKRRLRSAAALTCAALALGSLVASRAEAEHFDMLLRVFTADKAAQASMDSTPPIGGVNPRPVLKIKSGDTFRVTWRLKNSSPHGPLKGVGIHFFVVREEKTGQKPVPDPAGSAGVLDTSVTTDMVYGAATTGSAKLKITEPGSYLVRLQSEGTHDESGHEHFSAVDVEVQ